MKLENYPYETCTNLMIFQLNDRIKQFIASSAQPMAIFDHVCVQVHGSWKTSITNITGNVLVI